MVMLLRHLLSIALLPFTVAVVVPIVIASRYEIVPFLGRSIGELAFQIAGAGALAVGLLLFVSSLRRFASEGQGTLAPWDPPRQLVVRGPYRRVRNPMISGVVFVLFSEAAALVSRPHAAWALTFLAANAVYIPLLEEPMLQERFGEPYAEYRR